MSETIKLKYETRKRLQWRLVSRIRRHLSAVRSPCFLILLPIAVGACSGVDSVRLPQSPGQLVFAPEAPGPGARVSARYAPVGTLAGEVALVLRGQLRTSNHTRYRNQGLQNEKLAELKRRSDGNFEGSFILPDSVVYAAFVVEDAAGHRIDANGGGFFEIVVQASDGRPLYHGLMQRAYYFANLNWTTAYRSNRRAMELYPDSLAGWSELRFHERVALGSTDSDSLLAWHRANVAGIHARYSARASLSPEIIAAIHGYADGLADSVVVGFWSDRMTNEASGTYLAEQRRVLSRYADWLTDRDGAAALAAFEDGWPSARGSGTQIAEFALGIAIDLKDLEAVDRWTERMLEDDSRGTFFVASRLSRLPERRARALELAHGMVPAPDSPQETDFDLASDPYRPLGRTVGEYAKAQLRQRAAMLRAYAGLLVSVGRHDEALATLEEAAAEIVTPDLFQSLGDLRLLRGDSISAAADYAVAALDPGTSLAESNSLASIVGLSPDSPQWQRHLDSAQERILPRILADAVGWTPQPGHVTDAAGDRWALADLVTGGGPTVLVFWARSCGPCIAEIPELVRLRELVEPNGVDIVSITIDDLPGPGMQEFIDTKGVSYPVYYDLAREARDALGVSAIPANFVLDAQGRVRFAYTEISEVALQLEALMRLSEFQTPR